MRRRGNTTRRGGEGGGRLHLQLAQKWPKKKKTHVPTGRLGSRSVTLGVGRGLLRLEFGQTAGAVFAGPLLAWGGAVNGFTTGRGGGLLQVVGGEKALGVDLPAGAAFILDGRPDIV